MEYFPSDQYFYYDCCCYCFPAACQGVLTIETYLKQEGGEMDYNYVNHDKEYPSLNAINCMMLLSTAVYLCIVLGMPFSWLRKVLQAAGTLSTAEVLVATRIDDVKYPCDVEATEGGEGAVAQGKSDAALLQVSSLSHVYPDGTHAVKDVSFEVRQGEVLSFLGANGAGKSTCMGMLCGTLEATFGDAVVNGHSISTHRTLARRNLGIAMQQDIIWVSA